MHAARFRGRRGETLVRHVTLARLVVEWLVRTRSPDQDAVKRLKKWAKALENARLQVANLGPPPRCKDKEVRGVSGPVGCALHRGQAALRKEGLSVAASTIAAKTRR